jgi:hypothetical protein
MVFSSPSKSTVFSLARTTVDFVGHFDSKFSANGVEVNINRPLLDLLITVKTDCDQTANLRLDVHV